MPAQEGVRPTRCSFCGKHESEVQKLVAGPRVFICDACVAVAQRLMNESGENLAGEKETRRPGGQEDGATFLDEKFLLMS